MKVILLQKNGEYGMTTLTGVMTQDQVMSYFKNEGFNPESIYWEVYPTIIDWVNNDNGQVMGWIDFK